MIQGFKPREPRQKVVIPARMRVGNSYSDVCIRDISSRGMMLQAASPPSPGTYIEILRAAHTVVARVIWSGDRRFGIRAQDRMDIAAIVGASTSTGRASGQERRARERPVNQTVEQQAERSRRAARGFQFALLAAAGLIAAGLLGTATYEVLASPFHAAAARLVSGE